MGKLNAAGIAEIELEKARKKEELRVLTSIPFDLNNATHAQALNKYVDDFELSANRMYLYQGLKEGFYALFGLIGLKFIGVFITIPEFVQYAFSTVFYIGVIGHILQNFSTNDFFEQYKNTQFVYNWCLKNGKERYSEDIDNSDKLANPDIQKMIQLLAPFASVDFMMTWPKETAGESQPKSLLSSALSMGYSMFSHLGGSSSAPMPSPDQQQRIRELKRNVEMRTLDVGVFDGTTHALKYFSTRPEVAELWGKVQRSVQTIKEIPGYVGFGRGGPGAS